LIEKESDDGDEDGGSGEVDEHADGGSVEESLEVDLWALQLLRDHLRPPFFVLNVVREGMDRPGWTCKVL